MRGWFCLDRMTKDRNLAFGTAQDSLATALGKHMWETGLTSILPVANRVFEVMAKRDMTVFPEFKCAQQAMVYLTITLTPHGWGCSSLGGRWWGGDGGVAR